MQMEHKKYELTVMLHFFLELPLIQTFASQVMCKKEFEWFISPGSHYGKTQSQFTQVLVKLKGKKESRFSADNKSLYVNQKNLTSAFQYYLLQQDYRNKYGK